MTPEVAKLARRLNDISLAEKLVNGGFDMPFKIEQASDRELKEFVDLSSAELRQVRAAFPKAG